MTYNKKSILDINVAGKKVLLRCDFNVPQDKKTGEITDDKRIRAALPTIKYLLEQGAAVIACSHLGKPKGEIKPELSLAPVAARLGILLGKPVLMATDAVSYTHLCAVFYGGGFKIYLAIKRRFVIYYLNNYIVY